MIAHAYGLQTPFDVPHRLTWEQIWIALQRIAEKCKPESPTKGWVPLADYMQRNMPDAR